MQKSELTATLSKALSGEMPFDNWIEAEYLNWAQESDLKAVIIDNYAKYLGVDLDTLVGWITGEFPAPKDPALIQKLWDKYGFIYCFVADTPPPASVFPEGSSPREIRDAFEFLRSLLISREFPFEEMGDISKVLELMSASL